MHSRIKTEITALARANPTEEICGFICADPQGQAHVVQCANIHPHPATDFEIDVQDHIRALQVGAILGIYHSHPGTPSGFSRADPSSPDTAGDIEWADETAVPHYLVNTEDGSWFDYVPKTYTVPLEGRPWSLGFQDCWETPRIYYRQTFGIYMDDYDRDESFCHEEQGVIMDNFDREGFALLPPEPSRVRLHDILMFRTDKALPQHFAIFRGNSRMLHHYMGKLSQTELITTNWWDRLYCVFRHKSLI